MGLIERYGAGFIRIREALIDYPNISFSFEEQNGGTLTSYLKTAQKSTQENVAENVTENVTEDVTEDRVERMLKLIDENNKITTARLAKILGVSRMTIARDIDSLKQKNIIQRIGSPKGGHWKVI